MARLRLLGRILHLIWLDLVPFGHPTATTTSVCDCVQVKAPGVSPGSAASAIGSSTTCTRCMLDVSNTWVPLAFARSCIVLIPLESCAFFKLWSFALLIHAAVLSHSCMVKWRRWKSSAVSYTRPTKQSPYTWLGLPAASARPMARAFSGRHFICPLSSQYRFTCSQSEWGPPDISGTLSTSCMPYAPLSISSVIMSAGIFSDSCLRKAAFPSSDATRPCLR
mmetsp:Transcript_37922/g.82463  ORF Transcript_37922/g.82463 Transcript_37922/m.82463 type:complete len:222 (+) Transcript_37922:344-1009(+)